MQVINLADWRGGHRPVAPTGILVKRYSAGAGIVGIDAVVTLPVAGKMIAAIARGAKIASFELLQFEPGGQVSDQPEAPADAVPALIEPAREAGVMIVDGRP